MKIKAYITVILTACIFIIGVAFASDYTGEEQIDLDGGNKGNIDFPHKRHQNSIGDCSVCHDVFPKKAGVIQNMIAQGELKSKQVMNKTCIKCHKDMKKAGEISGPTSCSACHTK